jgi:hypothetical protein
MSPAHRGIVCWSLSRWVSRACPRLTEGGHSLTNDPKARTADSRLETTRCSARISFSRS